MSRVVILLVGLILSFGAFGADSLLDGTWNYVSVECGNGQSVPSMLSPEIIVMSQTYAGKNITAEFKVSLDAPAVDGPDGQKIELAGCETSTTVLLKDLTSTRMSDGDVLEFTSSCPNVFTKERTAASLATGADYTIDSDGKRLIIGIGPNEKTEATCGEGQPILNIYERAE